MTMTFDHPRFIEFHERLGGPEGCNFREERGGVTWDCKGGTDKTFAEEILRDMGFDEDAIRASGAYFEARGGFCDCEIALRFDPTHVDEELVRTEETIDRAIKVREAQEGDHAD